MASQNDLILRHLQRGRTLTQLSALRLFQCLRLGARVHRLRTLGYDIRTEPLTLSSGKRVARYSLLGGKLPVSAT